MKQRVFIGKATELPITRSTAEADGSWVTAPYPINQLRLVVENSSILQQAIAAYTNNIVGYGIVPEYIDESTENSGQSAEWDTAEEVLDWLSIDKSLSELFKEVLDDREVTGNAFLEVIRDDKGNVIQLERVKPELVQLSKPEAEPVLTKVVHKGKEKMVWKKFRKFKVDKYLFKEFGDPRQIDYMTGEPLNRETEGNKFMERDGRYAAREILHLKIGNDHWGVPRWIGNLVALLGARKAEELNFRYFTQGRHTPMAVLIKNGQLSEDAELALSSYVDKVGSESMQHKMLVLEAEKVTDGIDDKDKVDIEIKSLADMLQTDALFLEYDDKVREKVLSSFRLPPVYVGLSQDYNRSTVEEAKRIAEEQVFQAEREALEDLFNRHLLASYQLKEVKVEVRGPELSNDALIIETLDKLGSRFSDNEVRAIAGKLVGVELPVLQGEQHELPQGARTVRATIQDVQGTELSKAITSVMKDVRESLDEVNDTLGAWNHVPD